MTLRDFLKANRSLTHFKKMYHARSSTKITYRQIEANLLTAGENFIINALDISYTESSYWVNLNTKWNEQLKSKVDSSTNRTLGYWLKINNLEEKFKRAYLKRHPKCYSSLNCVLSGTSSLAISSSFTWCSTPEGHDFWNEQNVKWQNFCKNK